MQPHEPTSISEKRLAERVARGGITLPMLPEVPRRLVTAASSDTTDARSLAELIRRDSAVAGRLLRVANSAAFGGAVRIVSLQQAVARLGLDSVRRIALAIAVDAQVFRIPGFEATVRVQLDLALGAAWFAQEIARLRRLPVEEAFLAGLFHDLGRPAVIQAAVADGVPEWAVLELAERHHGEVGACIMSDWGLPPRLVAVARHHHHPESAGDAGGLCHLVTVADALAKATLLQGVDVPAGAVQRASAHGPPWLAEGAIAPEPLAELGLYADDLATLLGRADTVRALVRGA